MNTSLGWPRLACGLVDDVVLVALGASALTDEDAHRALVERQGGDGTRQILWTSGPPTRTLSRALYALFAGRAVPTAVISPVWAVRITVALLSLFDRQVRAFPPARLRDAVAFLGIAPRRYPVIERDLRSLCAELDGRVRARALCVEWREQLPRVVSGAPAPNTLAASANDAVVHLLEVGLWAEHARDLRLATAAYWGLRRIVATVSAPERQSSAARSTRR